MSKKGDKIYVEGYWRSSTNKTRTKKATKLTRNIQHDQAEITITNHSSLTLSNVEAAIYLVSTTINIGKDLRQKKRSIKKI
jgi:hypothetical protein